MDIKNLSAFIVYMDAARNTYYALLQDVKDDNLKTLESIEPQNKKHAAAIEAKKRKVVNTYKRVLKDFEKDMRALVDSVKLADTEKEECVEAGVDMVSELMEKTIYDGSSVLTGTALLEELKQKMWDSKGADLVALNHGEVKIYVPVEAWKADHGDCKGVEVILDKGRKVVVL